MINSNSEDRKIRAWQKDVVSSIADDASTTARDPSPTLSNAPPPPLVVNQIVTTSPVVVTRIRAPEPKISDEIKTKAIIGTVVGATAGAFIAYAMVKGDSENHQQPRIRERITYRTIEVPAEYEVGQSRPVTRVPTQYARQRCGSFADGNSGARALTIGPPSPRAKTLIPSSAHSHHSARSDPLSYHAASQRGPIVMIDNDTRSRASSARNTFRQGDLAHLPPSAPVTEVRLARDVPLPAHSQASRYTRATSATVNDKPHNKTAIIESREKLLPSVSPHDSISQAGTSISRDSGRSKHRHSSHHGRSKAASRREKDHEGGRVCKAGSKHHSKVGDMVEDVVSMVKGTSINDGEHRSRH